MALNPDNLRSLGERTTDEQRRIASSGGRASGEARTRRRIKAQRNTAIVAAVGLLAYAINK